MQGQLTPAYEGKTMSITHPTKPGLYPEIREDHYHEIDLVSNSRLSNLKVSPEFCRWNRDNPEDTKDAWRLGSAVHTLLLEPHRFMDRHGVFAGARRSKAEKENWSSMVETFGDSNVIRSSDYENAKRIRDAVYAHDAARGLLQRSTLRELTAIWDQPVKIDGKTIPVRSKARIDALEQSGPVILTDLKTTRDNSPQWFAKALFELGYFRQFAQYSRALAANGIEVDHIACIAALNVQPYTVRVYSIPTRAIEAGGRDLDLLYSEYARRDRDDDWRGDGGEAIDIDLPEWAYKRLGGIE